MEDIFEIKESRQIMNKRRKKKPQIEEIDLDEIFNASQKQILNSNKR